MKCRWSHGKTSFQSLCFFYHPFYCTFNIIYSGSITNFSISCRSPQSNVWVFPWKLRSRLRSVDANNVLVFGSDSNKNVFLKSVSFCSVSLENTFLRMRKNDFQVFFIIYCISIKTLLILINYQKGHIYIYIVKKTKNNLFFYDLNKFFTRRIRLINKYQSWYNKLFDYILV